MDLIHPAIGLVAQLLKLAGQAFADLARATLDLTPVAGLNLHLFGEPAFQASQGGGVGVFDGVAHKFIEQTEGVVEANLCQIGSTGHGTNDKPALCKNLCDANSAKVASVQGTCSLSRQSATRLRRAPVYRTALA